MSNIFITDLQNRTVNGKVRLFCLVQCPDCNKQREVRKDAYLKYETTCCRSCLNLRRPPKAEEDLFDWRDYYHSKIGKLAYLFQTQKTRCKEKGWVAPSYTQEELTSWGMALPEYHRLFEVWANSNYEKELSPSVDRLDDYQSYSLTNIQIVSWKENNDKGRYWQVIGKNTKNSLAVDQLDMQGNFIKRFHSIKAAERELSVDNSKIGNVCKGVPIKKGNRLSTPVSAGGFKWRYSTTTNPKTN